MSFVFVPGILSLSPQHQVMTTWVYISEHWETGQQPSEKSLQRYDPFDLTALEWDCMELLELNAAETDNPWVQFGNKFAVYWFSQSLMPIYVLQSLHQWWSCNEMQACEPPTARPAKGRLMRMETKALTDIDLQPTRWLQPLSHISYSWHIIFPRNTMSFLFRPLPLMMLFLSSVFHT